MDPSSSNNTNNKPRPITTGGIQFDRPVGAVADVKELEYICALHQTVKENIKTESTTKKDANSQSSAPKKQPSKDPTAGMVRQNATITAKDIHTYLKSRHGVQVDPQWIQENIVLELCGTRLPTAQERKQQKDTTASIPTMDLCQLTCLLMIPYLRHHDDKVRQEQEAALAQKESALKQQRSRRNLMAGMNATASAPSVRDLFAGTTTTSSAPSTASVHKTLVEHVYLSIMDELEANSHVNLEDYQELNDNFETATRLTPELVQCLLDAYGEHQVPEEILEEMVDMAAEEHEEKTWWNHTTFLRALAADVQHYNPTWDQSTFTATNNNGNNTTTTTTTTPTTHYQKVLGEEEVLAHGKLLPMAALPSIDQAADRYRSHAWTVLLWITLVLSYTLYLSNHVFTQHWLGAFDTCTSDIGESYGCPAASYVVTHILHFIQLGIVGGIYMGVGSWGNHSQPHTNDDSTLQSVLSILLAKGVVILFTILPAILESQNFTWDTTRDNDNFVRVVLIWVDFVLGVLLVLLQSLRLCDMLCGGTTSTTGQLSKLAAGGRTRLETATQQAAKKKINAMVEHAMLLHCPPAIPGQKLATRFGGGNNSNKLRLFAARHASDTVVQAAKQVHNQSSAYNTNTANTTTGASTVPTMFNIHDKKGRDKDQTGTTTPKTATRAMMGTQQKAMTHYATAAMQDLTEPAGGILWAYERMINGGLFHDEGIWIHARIMASNAVQYTVALLLTVLVLLGMLHSLDEELEERGVVEISRRLLPSSVREEHDEDQDQEAKRLIRQPSRYHSNPHHHNSHPRPHRHLQHRHGRRRHLQQQQVIVDRYNSTHYTDGNGVYPNIIFDHNRSHFTDGNSAWDFASFSHNGTHVFDRYYNYNETHFTDGLHSYAYDQFSTNGTHISNGEYLFDGRVVTTIRRPGGNINNVESWEYKAALSVGFAAAFLATLGIAIVYIPSFVSTVLKFRTGCLPSLKGGERFQQYRRNPNHVTAVLGSALWGSIFTAIVSWVLAGGLVFLTIWSETRDTFAGFYALLTGVVAVFVVKFLFVRMFRELYLSRFYRSQPAVVNVLNVVFESWDLALAALYMLVRSLKLLAVTTIYIGRIDVPMLAPGVGYIGPFELDTDHVGFKKDLLIHEAHRHPYLERLGMMYLMKVHHGSEFGTRAGAYWRMLFVLALMPWMRAYRVRLAENRRRETFEDEDDDETSYAGSEMTPYGLQLELDITTMANESLAKRNKDLKEALDVTRQRLREAKRNAKTLERQLEREKAKIASLERAKTEAPKKGRQVGGSQSRDERQSPEKSRSIANHRSDSTSDHETFSDEYVSDEEEDSEITEQRGLIAESRKSSTDRKFKWTQDQNDHSLNAMPKDLNDLDRPFAEKGDFQVELEKPPTTSGKYKWTQDQNDHSLNAMPKDLNDLDRPFAEKGEFQVELERPPTSGGKYKWTQDNSDNSLKTMPKELGNLDRPFAEQGSLQVQLEKPPSQDSGSSQPASENSDSSSTSIPAGGGGGMPMPDNLQGLNRPFAQKTDFQVKVENPPSQQSGSSQPNSEHSDGSSTSGSAAGGGGMPMPDNLQGLDRPFAQKTDFQVKVEEPPSQHSGSSGSNSSSVSGGVGMPMPDNLHGLDRPFAERPDLQVEVEEPPVGNRATSEDSDESSEFSEEEEEEEGSSFESEEEGTGSS